MANKSQQRRPQSGAAARSTGFRSKLTPAATSQIFRSPRARCDGPATSSPSRYSNATARPARTPKQKPTAPSTRPTHASATNSNKHTHPNQHRLPPDTAHRERHPGRRRRVLRTPQPLRRMDRQSLNYSTGLEKISVVRHFVRVGPLGSPFRTEDVRTSVLGQFLGVCQTAGASTWSGGRRVPGGAGVGVGVRSLDDQVGGLSLTSDHGEQQENSK